jgi:hypothetical protein
MDLENLETVADVFAALGDNPGVEAITGSKPSTLSMWRAAGSFPSNTYVVLTEALRAVGKTAPDSLWKMRSPASEAERVA